MVCWQDPSLWDKVKLFSMVSLDSEEYKITCIGNTKLHVGNILNKINNMLQMKIYIKESLQITSFLETNCVCETKFSKEPKRNSTCRRHKLII